MFENRIQAGMALANKLRKFSNEAGVVLAVPRGGVPIAYVIAHELGFPLDIVLTKKIGHPGNREYAIGAVSLTDSFIVPHADVSKDYIENEISVTRKRLRDMYRKFMGDHKPVDLAGKSVIVVDDGIATGNTLLATVRMLRRSNPGQIIVAAPVASGSAYEKLENEADEIICLLVPESFYGVGHFYEDFEQLSDEEVVYYLEKLRDERDKQRA